MPNFVNKDRHGLTNVNLLPPALYSTRFTKMFGDRAVPLLATLSLMSYLKLLRTIVDICLYTTLTVYPSESKIVIWYLDGNLLYGRYPHIFLLLVAKGYAPGHFHTKICQLSRNKSPYLIHCYIYMQLPCSFMHCIQDRKFLDTV